MAVAVGAVAAVLKVQAALLLLPVPILVLVLVLVPVLLLVPVLGWWLALVQRRAGVLLRLLPRWIVQPSPELWM